MKRIVSVVLTVAALGIAVPASAQDVYKVDVSGGFQYLAAKQEGDTDAVKFPGWYANLAGNMTKTVALVFSTSGGYNTISANEHVNFRILEFTGGVRVYGRRGHAVVPFGEVLAGGAALKGGARLRASSGSFKEKETDMAVVAGGGVNLMGGKAGLRIGGDYLHVNGKTGSALTVGKPVTAFRLVVGVVVGAGKV
jgi:hypothetical protein